MNNKIDDLKIIKKKYGEGMMHFCRTHFSSLLEEEGLLSSLLIDHFDPSHILYEDIINNDLECDFKNFIYSFINVEEEEEHIPVDKTPKELMDEAGYILTECQTESDIQSFKKYYAHGEELCTFSGDRLNSCRVFFAVKKDVDKIRREDFENPKRQDLYGTSVISIQFTKDEINILSIKNRYNHTVVNPDATFSNNLDNIIPGLTESFENTYGIVQKYKGNDLGIPNYVRANDGKYYKFNSEIRNIYYCPNNIVIDKFKAQKYEKEKYILFDYFILDIVNKKIVLYDESIDDSFSNTIVDIEKIRIENNSDGKEICIQNQEKEEIIISLDKQNRIIRYKNDNVKEITNNFLCYNETLEKLQLSNVEIVGDSFLLNNRLLKMIELQNLRKVGDDFLESSFSLTDLVLPKLEYIGDKFLYYNAVLRKINLPNAKKIGHDFFRTNEVLEKVELPELKEVGNGFLYSNRLLTELALQNLEFVGNSFLSMNELIRVLNLPNVKEVKNSFLYWNKSLEQANLPNLKKAGAFFLMNRFDYLDIFTLDEDFRKDQKGKNEMNKELKKSIFGCLR